MQEGTRPASSTANSQVDLSGQQEKSECVSLACSSQNASQLQPPFTYRNSTLAVPNLVGATIQHEMIVEYLYQQQRSRCWISDIDSLEEGAFMRDSWNSYITAPVLLSASVLAEALVDLNAEVSISEATLVVSSVSDPHLDIC